MKTNKEILKFALPAIAENFLQMLIGFVDTFVVAHIGLSAVAGVSLANNIIIVYQSIFIALGAMISSLFTKKIAEKNPKEIKTFVNASVKLTFIVGVTLGIFSALFASPLAKLLGARADVLDLSVEYLSLVGGLIVLLGLMTSFGSLLRARGNTKTPMWASLWTNVLNLLLAFIFVFVLQFGVLGSALATVFSRMVGTCYLYFRLKEDRPSLGFLKQKIEKNLIFLTLPAAGERVMMRLGDVLVMAIFISFGDHVFAGNSIGESITQFNYMPVFGMATVTVILVAQEFAQSSFENVSSYIKRSYWLSTILMAIISGLILLFSNPLIALFTSDPIAKEASFVVILFSFLATFFVTGTTTYTAAFQGLENAKLPFYATTIGMLLGRIGLGAFLGITLKLGIVGVQIGIIIDNLFRFLFLKCRYNKLKKSAFLSN